jgi:hypothetical protein
VGALLALVGLLFAIDVYATHSIFTSKVPGANDFYSRWKGAEVFWREGMDPYSDQATLAIQQGIYGRPALPGEDPGPFAYLFDTVFPLAPLTWLPYPWVEAIWLVTLQFSLIGGTLLCLSLVDWWLPPWLVGATALWAILFCHSARTILLGQFAGLVFLWTVGTLWALKAKQQVVAGVLLALTTIKPQMSFLLIPGLLLWGLFHQRWRFLAAFAISMALLVGASFLLLPGWLGRFLGQLSRYTSYTAIGSPVWILCQDTFPQLGTAAEIGLSVLLLLYLLVQWRHLRHVEEIGRVFRWILGMTLIVTSLVALRTATTKVVVLSIPLFFALEAAAERLRKSHLLLPLFYLLATVSSWVLFLFTVEGKFEHPIMYLPLPIGLFVAFLWAKAALQRAPAHLQRGAA